MRLAIGLGIIWLPIRHSRGARPCQFQLEGGGDNEQWLGSKSCRKRSTRVLRRRGWQSHYYSTRFGGLRPDVGGAKILHERAVEPSILSKILDSPLIPHLLMKL